MIVALDFDGTLAKHNYPKIGDDIGAIEHLTNIQQEFKDVRYMLWTVRSNDTLDDAIEWCASRFLWLWSYNVNPEQSEWSTSPKAHAHTYVDDAALGAPLVIPSNGDRPYIDWDIMGPMLFSRVYGFFNHPKSYETTKANKDFLKSEAKRLDTCPHYNIAKHLCNTCTPEPFK